MSDMKIVLQEDDKAPDARKYFGKAFDKETGGCFKTLMGHCANRDDGYCLYWDLTMPNGVYVLSLEAGDPFFKLSKEVMA